MSTSLTKSQITIEFVLIAILLLLALTFFTYSVYFQISNTYDRSLELEANSVGTEAADQISIAYESGPGYSKNYSLPSKIIDQNYNISVYSGQGSIEVSVSGSSYIFSIVTKNVTGNFTEGNNIIKNVDGLIRID